MHGYYYQPFTFPFIVGVIFLFAKIWTRFFSWISVLPKSDKKLIFRHAVSKYTFIALWEAFSEILLHRRMFRINKRLWYMHMSLAFGWFLMIAVSKLEVAIYLGNPVNPPYVEAFFNYYFPHYENKGFDFIMDLLLLFVLSGVAMAVFKRKNPKQFGVSIPVQRSGVDRTVMYALWTLFPLRLLCESVNAGLYDSGGFLTGTLGIGFSALLPERVLFGLNEGLWWSYSISTALFLVLLPFSRYLHIFAEIPLVFLRNFGVAAKERPTTFTFLESAACSQCGLCREVCPMVKNGVAGVGDPLNFIRAVRSRKRQPSIVDNCLMCGECERVCPVRVEHTTIRIGERYVLRHSGLKHNFEYINPTRENKKDTEYGYFAGCASHLDPKIIESVKSTFDRFCDSMLFLDAEGELCCGSQLKKMGYLSDSVALRGILIDKILRSGVSKLVCNCPTCYDYLSKDQRLSGRVVCLLYVDYVASKIERETVVRSEKCYSLFASCSMKLGTAGFEAAKKIVELKGVVSEDSGVNGCCGGSLANAVIAPQQRTRIALGALAEIDPLVDCVVTLCPTCKRMLQQNSPRRVCDIAEIVVLD